MRYLICGDRDWTNENVIANTLPKDCTVVIEGEARGADILGRIVAQERDIKVLRFLADWKQYGRAAGYIRNKQMLVEGKPDFILAYHDNIKSSKGTKNMIAISKTAHVHGRLYNSKGEIVESW